MNNSNSDTKLQHSSFFFQKNTHKEPRLDKQSGIKQTFKSPIYFNTVQTDYRNKIN